MVMPSPPCMPPTTSSPTPNPSAAISYASSNAALSPKDFKSPSIPPYLKSPPLPGRSPGNYSHGSGGGTPARLVTGSTKTSPIVNPRKRPSPIIHDPNRSRSNSARSSPRRNEIPAPPVVGNSNLKPSPLTIPTNACSPTASQPQPESPSFSSNPKRIRTDSSVKVLPRLYQFCPTTDLVILISDMLSELVGLNDKIPLSGAGLTRFHSRAPPTISIPDYLSRLSLHASLQPSILLSMVYYIDILSTHYPPFVISSLTVHRFLITAATVASKGLCDSFLTNSFYAKVGGVSLMELNMLELEFLVRVGWRIVPKGEILGEYYNSLVGRLSGRFRIASLEEEAGTRREELAGTIDGGTGG
ncbi:Pho80p cyclin [Rhizina undulata]